MILAGPLSPERQADEAKELLRNRQTPRMVRAGAVELAEVAEMAQAEAAAYSYCAEWGKSTCEVH
jgi:hypothetical protein